MGSIKTIGLCGVYRDYGFMWGSIETMGLCGVPRDYGLCGVPRDYEITLSRGSLDREISRFQGFIGLFAPRG